MASANRLVQQSGPTIDSHDDYIDDVLYPSVCKYALAQGVSVDEVMVCAVYRLSVELSLSGASEAQLKTLVSFGVATAQGEEVRHGQC